MSNFTKLKLCHTLGISQSTHIWVKGALTALLLVLCGNVAKAQEYQSFDASKNYTKILIDAKINDFAGNTKPMGFGSYDATSGTITQPTWYDAMDQSKSRDLVMDYVAGLVAKACIEAADYYKDFTWSKPWFKLIENYATKVTVPTTGASLDDLNASKMYFALAELTKKGAKYENSTTYNKAITELKNALKGLKAVKDNYSIRSGSTVNYYSSGNKTCELVDAKGNKLSPATSGMNAIGGWYHKATYPNEMWCDSEYMGPALLAQLVAYAANNKSAGIGTITGTTEGDWKLIAKQFDITWNYLWNSTDKLLYHGFSATPTAVGAHTYTWATGKNGTNTAYWGRAIGWYFLALVDVLENMPDNITDDSYTSTQDNLNSRSANIKTRLKSYLTDLADGIWKQKKDNNLWTNVINESVDTEHNSYSTTSAVIQKNTKNYLEASASAIYIATYLKAMRLGLLPSDYISGIQTAYSNYISNFITTGNNIINTCASAGLGGGDVNITSEKSDYGSGGKKYRNGTADYYTRGYDVTKITTYQEGKPLGAFILASTEYERFMKADYEPSFTAEYAEVPTAQTVTKGQSVTLHAAAMAKPLAKYQWFSYPASDAQASKAKRATTGTAISGATSSDLTVTPEANTYYYCVATNDAGSAQTEPVLLTVSEGDNEGTNTPTETTDLFTLTVVTSETVTVNSKKSVDVSNEYATITGGSAQLYNGHADPKNMIVDRQINLSGSSSSYLKITLDNALEVGDEIIITPTASKFKLSDTNSDSGDKSFSGSYVIQENDAVVGKNVIYIYKVDSSSKIETINITRNNRGNDSRATFTYGSSQLTFTTTSEGKYTTTLEVGASKRGKDINITPTAQEGASIKKEDGTTVSSTITITAPSTTGTTAAHTYTVTSKDGSSTTTYIINVKVVKEKITLVYSDSNGKTEWTWNSTTTPTMPTFNSPTVKAYIKNAEGVDELLTDETLSYTYESDVTSVATVDASSGTITIVESGNGGAKIYATLNENENYYADPAFFNVLLEQGYSFSVGENETAPAINTSKYITRTTSGGTENLVKMTFGGWKWEGYANKDATEKTLGSYKVVRADKTTYYTDKWNNSGTKASDIASIDGHYYWWNGENDAVDESKAPSDENIYGSIRYGWFKSPEHDGDGKTTVSYPFTLPVRGSYMTFEPTMNGTLTIYILQNGAWNTNDNGGTYPGKDGNITYQKGDIIPGQFRPHAFQVVNQRGLTVQEFSPKYSVSTKQKVDSRYYCMFTEDEDYNQTKYNNPYNVAKWTEFAGYMSVKEQKRAHDSWNSGPLGAQKIIELDNGSFLAVQKGIVKYTFHVTGNETYYFFSNFSKMGFSGANFVPDEAQPQETVSGKISTLELRDVTAYDEITPTPTGSTIEGTNLKDYTYSINGTEIAPVAGVSIPQFYSIKLNRTFMPNQWTTLTLPFNLTEEEVQKIFGDGTRLVMLHDATLQNEGAHLTFIYHEIQNVLPGYPYLIKPTLKDITNDANVSVTKADNNTALTSFTVFGKCINPFIKQFEVKTTPYTFKGTPGYCTADKTNNGKTGYSVNYAENDIFVSEGNGNLYVSGGSSYGKGYRAWLQKNEGTAGVKSISVVMSSFSDDDDTTTSIDVAEMAPDLIEALGIQTGVYNLSGQRVANDTRNLKAGIYIVNGKKTVVR